MSKNSEKEAMAVVQVTGDSAVELVSPIAECRDCDAEDGLC